MRTHLEEIGPTASDLHGEGGTLKGAEADGEGLVMSKAPCSFFWESGVKVR
jgi:hypothetical protein